MPDGAHGGGPVRCSEGSAVLIAAGVVAGALIVRNSDAVESFRLGYLIGRRHRLAALVAAGK